MRSARENPSICSKKAAPPRQGCQPAGANVSARSTNRNPAQVDRALAQLGITHIPSYPPEARGRMERVFGTIQSRLPPELRVAEIATLAAANRCLKEVFVPDDNARCAVPAAEPGSAFIP